MIKKKKTQAKNIPTPNTECSPRPEPLPGVITHAWPCCESRGTRAAGRARARRHPGINVPTSASRHQHRHPDTSIPHPSPEPPSRPGPRGEGSREHHRPRWLRGTTIPAGAAAAAALGKEPGPAPRWICCFCSLSIFPPHTHTHTLWISPSYPKRGAQAGGSCVGMSTTHPWSPSQKAVGAFGFSLFVQRRRAQKLGGKNLKYSHLSKLSCTSRNQLTSTSSFLPESPPKSSILLKSPQQFTLGGWFAGLPHQHHGALQPCPTRAAAQRSKMFTAEETPQVPTSCV